MFWWNGGSGSGGTGVFNVVVALSMLILKNYFGISLFSDRSFDVVNILIFLDTLTYLEYNNM